MNGCGRFAARRKLMSAAVEVLEQRQLLTGAITGLVYNDLDADGVRDAGEPGLAGRTVFVDANDNGAPGAGELSVVTDANGNYTLSGVPAGAVSLAQALPTDFVPTAPPNRVQRVIVTDNQTTTAANFGSVRPNPKFFLDSTFGAQGERIDNASNLVDIVAVRQLNDGKILVAGSIGMNATLWRYNENGTPDTTFGGGDGVLQPNVPAGFLVQAMEVTPDNQRILLGGSNVAAQVGVRDIEVVSLQSNGNLDLGFTGDGHTVIDFGGDETFADLAIGPDGKIVIVGNVREQSRDEEVTVAVAIGQLQPSGIGDFTFSDDGRVVLDISQFQDNASSVVIQSDNKILVAGWRTLPARDAGLLFRVNPNGALDFTYGSGGTAVIDSGGGLQLRDVALQSDSRAVVVGDNGLAGFVYRRMPTGVADTSFSGGGGVTLVTDVAGALSVTRAVRVVVNSQGLIAVGTEQTGVANGSGLFTLTASGERDRRFLRAGRLGYVFTGSANNDAFGDLFLRNDNKIVAAASLAGQTKIGLLRTTDVVPLASVNGTVFDDTNGNGVREAGEGPAVGRIVFIDLDDSGQRDTGEPFVATDASGNWGFNNLVADDYVVRLTAPEGFAQTYPTLGMEPSPIVLSLIPGQSLGGQTFGLFAVPPTITPNANGPYTVGEGGVVQLLGSASIAGGVITGYEWDFNYDGITFTTDSTLQNPIFSAGDVDAPAAGINRTVALRVRSGTFPPTAPVTATVTINNVAPTAILVNNGPVGAGSTNATVTFTQQNDPAAPDRNAGFKYAYDFNNDGTFDIVDSTVATAGVPANVIAASGNYTITGRITDKDGGSRNVTTILVVNPPPPPGSFSGLVFDDLDRDGLQDAGEAGLPDRTVFIDTDNDGNLDAGEASAMTSSVGAYEFASVVPGTYRVRQVVPAGLTQTLPANNAAREVVVVSGQQVMNVNFATAIAPAGATLRGVVFLDTDRDGVRDAGETGVAGRSIYLDNNNNGVRDAAEPQTTTGATGAYEFTGLTAGTYKIRQILPAGFIQTTPGNNFGNNATVSGTQVAEGLNFGTAENIAPTGATLRGVVFLDTDRDGVRDAGEAGVSGRTVYLDANNNGIRDGSETQTTTNGDGVYQFTGLVAGTYKIRQILPTGFVQTTPANNFGNNATVAGTQVVDGLNFGTAEQLVVVNGSISGFLWRDDNANGVQDGSEPRIGERIVFIDADRDGQLDAGERQTTTNSNGEYSFGNLAAGSYRVRRVLPSGFRVSFPSAGFHEVALAQGQNATGRNIGSTDRVLISGQVFEDKDGDRVRDSNEGGLSGWRVFIDADNDGNFDSGERSIVTGSDGNYSFNDLVAGTYRVRVVQQSGFTRTTPTSGVHQVTLSAGATATGRLFGQRRIS